MRGVAVAVVMVSLVVACRDRKAPARPDPVEHVVGAWPEPVWLEPVALATELAPNVLRDIPGTGWAAASGQLDGAPALVVVDVDAAAVRWTDTTACGGELVHATRERLVCGSGRGMAALDVDSGALVWRSERAFVAAHGTRVFAAGAMLDVDTGAVVREVEPGPVNDRIRELCDDGAFAVAPSGAFTRLDEKFAQVWQVKLSRLPSDVHACRDPILIEVPRPGSAERSLIALSRETGQAIGEPLEVLGWWPARDSAGIETATAAGIAHRAADLTAPQPVVEVEVAGRLVASREDVRLVRAVAGSMLLMDGEGLRAWLAAPSSPRRVVLGARNLLAAGWVGPLSLSHRLTLWRLPATRSPWPEAPLRPQEPAKAAAASAVRVPDAMHPVDGEEIAVPGRGMVGVSAVAVRGTRVVVAHHSARPGAGHGGDVSAFDLVAKKWLWHQEAGCADGESVVDVLLTERMAVCATRSADGTGTLVAVAQKTGAPLWRVQVGSVDRLAAGRSRVAVAAGAQWVVVDDKGGVQRGRSRDGNVARFAFAGERFVVVDGAQVVADGATPWRVRVRGLIVDVAVAGPEVLVHTAAGELYAIAAESGTPERRTGWSAGWEVPTAGDLYFDFPVSADPETFVLRSQAFALALPRSMQIVGTRAGAGAPVMLIDRKRGVRILAVDSQSGAIEAVFPWPRRAAQRGVFSAVADGLPVKGVVLSRPLAVVLL